jgi:IS1 family transposase
MNKLKPEKRKAIVAALVEGNSIRATCRMTGAAKGTVLKLLADLGEVCAEYQHKTLRNLTCRHIECDEIWGFCYAKEKNVPDEKRDRFGFGNVWTWTALCADSKLVPSWLIGSRDYQDAKIFMQDLASRMAHRVQITTDGHRAYLEAVEDAFGSNCDYSQLIKIYGLDNDKESKYSPPHCIGTKEYKVVGNPDKAHVSTSYVERQNLTMRMSMRRFTRLTNAFSKKIENLGHAVALHFMHYNFCRIHRTLRVTPAMAAGVTEKLWEIEDIIALLEEREPN